MFCFVFFFFWGPHKKFLKNVCFLPQNLKPIENPVLGFAHLPQNHQMARRNTDPESTNCSSFLLLCLALISCALVYAFLSVVLRPSDLYTSSTLELVQGDGGYGDLRSESSGECCRGTENLELWGAAMKWGSEFKFNSSEECCKACKAMCTGNDGPCLCDTWVFCGNRQTCGSKFGEVI